MSAPGVQRLETAAQIHRAWIAGLASWLLRVDDCPYDPVRQPQQYDAWGAGRVEMTPARGTPLPCRLHGLAHRP